MSNLSFSINADAAINNNGDFLWNNYNNLTTSSFSQLSESLGANDEVVTIDFDNDMIKGNVLINGQFSGYAMFLDGQLMTIPVSAELRLMGSGMLGLFPFSRCNV